MMLHSGSQGMRSLISSVEVHEALSYETLDLKRMERLADWGGLTFFQLTGQLQRGVDRLHAQAVVRSVLQWPPAMQVEAASGSVGVELYTWCALQGPEPAKKQDKAGRLRCHDGVCWREYDGQASSLSFATTLLMTMRPTCSCGNTFEAGDAADVAARASCACGLYKDANVWLQMWSGTWRRAPPWSSARLTPRNGAWRPLPCPSGGCPATSASPARRQAPPSTAALPASRPLQRPAANRWQSQGGRGPAAMSRRRTVTLLAQLPRWRISSRDIVRHLLPERDLLRQVKVGHPTLHNTPSTTPSPQQSISNAGLVLRYCALLQDDVASIFGGPGAHPEVWQAQRIPCADDAGSLTAAAPQGDRGDVDIGQPSVRGTMHSMSNGPLSHGMPPGVGAGPPQEAPSSTPKHAHWHLPRPCLRLPFFGGQPAIKDVRSPPSLPVSWVQLPESR